MVRILTSVLLFAVACSTPAKRVELDAYADHGFYLDRYQKGCVAVVGPASCKDCKAALERARADILGLHDAAATGATSKLWKQAVEDRMKELKKSCPSR